MGHSFLKHRHSCLCVVTEEQIKNTQCTETSQYCCWPQYLHVAALITTAQNPPHIPPSKIYAILLGTGFPRPDADRAGPSTAIVIGEKVFLIDTGRGVTMRLAAANLAPKNIRAVFLTHSAFRSH